MDIQTRLHTPLINWFCAEFDVELNISKRFRGVEHSHDTMQKIQWMLFSTDDWRLSCLDVLTRTCKSFIIAAALWKRRITLAQAFEASNTEELYQQSNDGTVIGVHDMEKATWKLQAASALYFLYMLPPPTKKT